MAVRYNPKTVSDGLLFMADAANVRSYPGTGTSFFDISGNENNSESFTNVTSSNWDGISFEFNGTDEHIRFPNVTTNTNSFSVECWANWSTLTDSRVPFGLGAFFRLYLSGGSPTFWIRETGSGTTRTTTYSGSSIDANEWYHLVGTCQGGSGGSMKLYSDGVFGSSNTVNFNVDTGTSDPNMYIGNAFNGSTSYFPGKVSIAKVYNRVLTDEEVFGNYNALKGRFGL